MFKCPKWAAFLTLSATFMSFPFFCCTNLQAQTFDPTQMDLSTTAVVQKVNGKFLQDNFVLGWNWNDRPPRALSEALNMNLRHGTVSNFLGIPAANTNDATDDMQLIALLDEGLTKTVAGVSVDFASLATGWNSLSLLQGMAMHYSPVNTIGTNGNLTVFDDGTHGPAAGGTAFGFRTKHPNASVVHSGSGNNAAYRYELTQSAFAGTSHPAKVLADPWPNDVMFRFENFAGLGNVRALIDGSEWYVSINLRRLPSDANLSNTSTVLTLKLPYTIGSDQNTTRYIMFNMVPGTLTTELSGGRGKVNVATSATSVVTNCHITREMLPQTSSSGSSSIDVTVSAKFELNGLDFINHDLAIASEVPNDATGNNNISTLGIEVDYHGTADVAINWIRFETPNAQALFRGEHDADITNIVNNVIDDVSDIRNSTDPNEIRPNLQISRFYGIDEARIPQWHACRYLNVITGGRMAIERGFVMSAGTQNQGQRRYFADYWSQLTGANERWISGWHLGGPHTAPYILGGDYTNKSLIHYLNFASDFRYNGDPNLTNNFLMGYESGLHLGPNVGWSYPPISDGSAYDNFLANTKSKHIQAYWENTLHFGYFNNRELLFGEEPWWANVWAVSAWNDPTNQNTETTNPRRAIIDIHRPKTGEELRMELWTYILAGAKGLVHYRGTSPEMVAGGVADHVGISNEQDFVPTLNGQPLTGQDLLENDNVLGGDFVDLSPNATDHTNLREMLRNPDASPAQQDININLIIDGLLNGGENLGNTKLYLGRRSMRLEIAKMHDWISSASGVTQNETVGDLLMRLRLDSWYGRGFRATPHFTSRADNAPAFFESVLDGDRTEATFINDVTDVSPDGDPVSDNRFFDLMLLEDESETEEIYYVGVVNRLTNPALVTSANLSSLDPFRLYVPSTNSIVQGAPANPVYFITSSQMDELATTANFSKYDQVGSRHMRVKFNYAHQDGYALLHVREVGTESQGLDMVIGQDKFLELDMQPGEGRFFQIEVLAPDRVNNPKGELAYANQRKLAVRRQVNGIPTHQQYLSVYHRNVDVGGGQNKDRVFYRASIPGNVNGGATADGFADSDFANIEWETTETELSANIILQNGNPLAGIEDCSHPAIVHREAEDMVYVVYACLTLNGNLKREIHIVENKFAPNAPSSTGRVLATFDVSDLTNHANPLDAWGTPVINAAADYNYIAWAESCLGIGVGVKTPSANTFLATTKIRATPDGSGPDRCADQIVARHPALNSYSRITTSTTPTVENDPECALVWQEGASPLSNPAAFSEIYYTRLRYNTQTQQLEHFLANGTLEWSGTSRQAELTDSDKIMILSRLDPGNEPGCDSQVNVAPVLHRDQAQQLMIYRKIGAIDNLNVLTYGKYISECVAWARDDEEGDHNRIFLQLVDFFEHTFNNTLRTTIHLPNVRMVHEIGDRSLARPDLTNGVSLPRWWTMYSPQDLGSLNGGPSNFVLNYIASSSNATLTYGRHLNIAKHGNFSSLDEDEQLSEEERLRNSRIAPPMDDIGYTQLGAIDELTFDAANYRRTRRVYDLPSTGEIVANAKHFYKKEGDIEEVLIAPGCRNFCSTYIFFWPTLVDNTLVTKPIRFFSPGPSASATLTHDTQFPAPDVLSSDWFDFNSGDVLSFYVMGIDSGCVKGRLRRLDDSTTIDVDLPRTDKNVALKVEYTILNPAATQYRLELSFNDSDPISTYTETFLAGEFEVENGTITGMLKGEQQTRRASIDLGFHSINDNAAQMALHPHPANDFVNILVRNQELNSQALNITVRDVRGRVIKRAEGQYGVTLRLETADWSAGMYTVEAAAANPGTYALPPVRSTLLINP